MPFDVTSKPRPIVAEHKGRRPNFTLLAESDRLPDGNDGIPLAQRQTIITVGRSHCRWPFGDPKRGDFCLCGAQAKNDDSYCAYHMKIAYPPPSNPKRAA
ncbi:MAG: GcrA family cell cycle regulator [Hyphomicrobiaceae bacterium]